MDWSLPVFRPLDGFVAVAPQELHIDRYGEGSLFVLRLRCESGAQGALGCRRQDYTHITLGRAGAIDFSAQVKLEGELLLGPEARTPV